MVKQINTQEEFEEIIKSEISIIDFWAEWCMPCVMFSPVFESLLKKFKNISFAKVNVDDNNELAVKFGIDSIPCILIFKKGRLADRIVGALPEKEFEKRIIKIQ